MFNGLYPGEPRSGSQTGLLPLGHTGMCVCVCVVCVCVYVVCVCVYVCVYVVCVVCE